MARNRNRMLCGRPKVVCVWAHERARGAASVGIDARPMTSAPDTVEPMRCE
eukprot:SAG31_NODE_26199_length_446_cov_1.175793_1_plen_50_part_01